MVGRALMTRVNILQTGQSTVIHVMNGKEESELKRSTETKRCPAYQARKLIRTQGDYLQEDPNE